jgi:hypothetical protein
MTAPKTITHASEIASNTKTDTQYPTFEGRRFYGNYERETGFVAVLDYLCNPSPAPTIQPPTP